MFFQIGGIIFGLALALGLITSVYGRIFAEGPFDFPNGKELKIYNRCLLVTAALAAIGGGLMIAGRFCVHR
jgi:hypothetical protein